MKYSDLYLTWLNEDLQRVEELRQETQYWQGILKKRAFDGKWPDSIKCIITALEIDIKQILQETHHYLSRIKELKDAEFSQIQSGQNQDTVTISQS